MTENPTSFESLPPEWKERIEAGIAEAIENYELFDRKIDFSPLVITGGKDERSWPELSDSERKYITSRVFSAVGLRNNEVATYKITSPEKGASWQGLGEVVVYETKRSESDDMYIHKISRPGVEIEYIVAPKDYRL